MTELEKQRTQRDEEFTHTISAPTQTIDDLNRTIAECREQLNIEHKQ